jgi:hypothetical protein
MRRKEGIAYTFTSRKDYPGYIKNRKILSFIASKTGSRSFKVIIDKGLSLKDIYRDDLLSFLKFNIHKKINAVYNKFDPSPPPKINISESQDELGTKYNSFVNEKTILSSYLRA